MTNAYDLDLAFFGAPLTRARSAHIKEKFILFSACDCCFSFLSLSLSLLVACACGALSPVHNLEATTICCTFCCCVVVGWWVSVL